MTAVTGPAVTLRGLRVGLSGAVPEPELWGGVDDLDRIILRFVAQFSALVMKYGGHVIHGTHPSFTPVVAAQAGRFQEDRSSSPLTLVASEFFGSPPKVMARASQVAECLLTPRIDFAGATEAEARNLSLTALRLTLAEEADVIVAIGGKLHQTTGYVPGVLEEVIHARQRGLPCFLVATYGGFSGFLDASMLRQFSHGNKMDGASLEAMAVWSNDVDECAGTLLEHLLAHRDEFLQRGRARTDERSTGRQTPRLDLATCRAAANRVTEVRKAFDRGDVARVGELLNPGSFNQRSLVR